MPEELKKGAVKPNAQASPGPIGNTQGIIVPKTATHPDGDSAPKPQPQPKEEGWWKRWGSDWTHNALDVVGLIPVAGELSDGANALIYAAEGDKINAAISLTAMIPIAGDAATAGKWAVKGAKQLEKEILKEAEEAAAKKLAKEAEDAAAKKAAKEAEEKAAKGGYVEGPRKQAVDIPEVRRKIPKDKLKYKPKERGNAPIGEDGKPVELHHIDQSKGNVSPRDEMTRTDHRGKESFKDNHPNTGQSPSTVDRAESSKQHKKYWKSEWDTGRFKELPDNQKPK